MSNKPVNNSPLGIFDSGLGGLTVVKSLLRALPDESIVYFGDTGRVPYGTRSRETIIKYSAQDINFLTTKDVKAIIIACGTASSVALKHLEAQFDLPIIGVVSATAKAAAAATKNNKIGVLGTNSTVNSGSYDLALQSINPEIQVFSQACPLFVPLVENNYTDKPAAKLIAADYLSRLKEIGVDTIILGCTHYPLLKDIISDIMGSDTALIDSGEPVANEVKALLTDSGIAADIGNVANYQYYVSDSTDNFSNLGSLFMERELSGSLQMINIEEY